MERFASSGFGGRFASGGVAAYLGVTASAVVLTLGAAFSTNDETGIAQPSMPPLSPPVAWFDRADLGDLDPYRGVDPPTADSTYGSWMSAQG